MSIAITVEQFKEFMGYKKGYYRLKEEKQEEISKQRSVLADCLWSLRESDRVRESNEKLQEENKKLEECIKVYEEDAEKDSKAAETLKFMGYVWKENCWEEKESN